ncbi:T9SS type A sorting domain-containing protein [Larkinella rosea]|uniref:T9SS C-terminal target domain-containing protein n=1 Tax=Larkinella rosea TaxID=2025312 RepID=A0A3P1BDZ2_9BACT|nr:T9SS type A sorting domain-containing protein [Larkinella rosea]RRA99125.1 T9SS C-terminal target domain-containing protein [Larkinella rosea]
MATLPFNRRRMFYAATKLLLCFIILLNTSCFLFAQSYSAQLDANGFYHIQQTAPSTSATARKAQQATISITDDSRRPTNAVMLTVSFGPEINLNTITSFFLLVKTSPEFLDFGETVYISSKAVDKTARTMQIPVGGLKENTDYYFTLSQFSGCDGEETAQVHYKTGTAPKKPKKVLLVMDNQYENDPEIQQALTVYKADVTRTDPNLVFEQTYLSAAPAEKGQLYEKIKARFYDSEAPLHYLFFIGRIPSASIRSDVLDHKTNQPLPGRQNWFSSLGVYAKILTQDFPFNTQENLFISRRYDCQLAGKEPISNDITPVFFQSSITDISYGAVVPTRPEEGKAYILRYFEKLHQFKTGKLKFDKKVLLADTFYNDGTYPKKIEQLTGRWTHNDTINVPQKYGPSFNGFDPVWKADYLKKLGSNSYEIVSYSGHGEPTQHYYGITPTEINNIEKLNTLLFDFTSCSVGNVDYQDYLAGTYLDKGNTLFVNSYSTPINVAVIENQSPLLYKFKEKETFNAFSKGTYVSDAYRHGHTSNIVQYLLGDPLLSLTTACVPEPLVISSVGSLSLCPGDTATLRVSGNFTNLRWFRNGTEISQATGTTLKVGQGGLYTAKARQCEQEITSDQGVTVTDKPGPVMPVLTVETLPDRFRLRVTPAGAFSGGFNWFINGSRWQETTQDTVKATLLGANYTVKVFQNECSATSKPVTIRIDQPVLTVTGANPACSGDSIVVKAPENFSSYAWLTQGGATVVTTSNTRIYKQNAVVAVTPSRGTLEGPTSAYVTLTFKPKPPKPTITLESAGFRSSSPVNNQWYLNGNPLPDSTRQLLRNPGAGTYRVRVTDQGCFSDSDPMIITAVEPALSSLKVYPNPSNGTFRVEWPDSFRSGNLDVVDNLGRKVYSRFYAGKPAEPVLVPLKTAPGLYLLQLSTDGQTKTVKLLVK